MKQFRLGNLETIITESQGLHAITFILPSIVVSILINIPKFMETELVFRNITDQVKCQINVICFKM